MLTCVLILGQAFLTSDGVHYANFSTVNEIHVFSGGVRLDYTGTDSAEFEGVTLDELVAVVQSCR